MQPLHTKIMQHINKKQPLPKKIMQPLQKSHNLSTTKIMQPNKKIMQFHHKKFTQPLTTKTNATSPQKKSCILTTKKSRNLQKITQPLHKKLCDL